MDLRSFFLNDAENPGDKLALRFVGDTYRYTPRLGGGIDHGYASGRSRIYSTESDIATVAFTASRLSWADIGWIIDHRGRTICFRDHMGLKLFVGYHEPPFDLSTLDPSIAIHTVPMSLSSVTWDEAV